jgi:V/A-type H+-transporting ATPase subunit B
VTVLPVLTMPAGDITHPVPDLTGYITEGQVLLSAEAQARGTYPPVEPLGSLSRLMRHGAGPGRTREDHLEVAAQVIAALSRARQVHELAELLGETALSETDRAYLRFESTAERTLLDQDRGTSRTLAETLDLAWRALAELPRGELATLDPAMVAAHLDGVRPTPAQGRS